MTDDPYANVFEDCDAYRDQLVVLRKHVDDLARISEAIGDISEEFQENWCTVPDDLIEVIQGAVDNLAIVSAPSLPYPKEVDVA